MLTRRSFTELIHPVLDILNDGRDCERLPWPGAWATAFGNWHVLLEGMGISKTEYPELPELGDEFYCYGVCDSPEQFMGRYQEKLETSDRLFVVTFMEMRKDEQPEWGGWRWHKWGDYIGDGEPTTEYLYDEELFDVVHCYHVYELVETADE